MSSIFRTDIASLASQYLRANMQGLNPYNSNWYPSYTNTAYLAPIDYSYQDTANSIPAGEIDASPVVASVTQLCSYYAQTALGHWGLHDDSGVEASGTGYFFYNPAYLGSHVQNVVDQANIQPPTGNVSMASVSGLYAQSWSAISARLSEVNLDLTVCHSSCHTSCHGSRGRR